MFSVVIGRYQFSYLCCRPSYSITICAKVAAVTEGMLGQQLITIVPFSVTVNAYNQIIGRQQLCIASERSIAQVGESVLSPYTLTFK